MPQQIFKQPQRSKKPEDEPSFQPHYGDRSREALKRSEEAGDTVGDIDRVLNEQAQQSKLPWKPDTGQPTKSGVEPKSASSDLSPKESKPPWKEPTEPAGQPGKKRRRSLSKKAIKRWAVGSLITLLMGGVGGILGVLPNKLDFLFGQMEDKFYSRLEHFVEARGEKMLFRYLAVNVFGNINAINACQEDGEANFTVKSDCFYSTKEDFPQTKLGQMYAAWKQRRIEKKLDPIQIEYRPNTNKWVARIPTGETIIDPDNPELGTQQLLQQVTSNDGSRVGKADFYRIIWASFLDHSKPSFMVRAAAKERLRKHYGLENCIFFCSTRDRVDTTKLKVKNAFKGFLAARVTSVNGYAGLLLECVFTGGRQCKESDSEWRTKRFEQVEKIRSKNPSIDKSLEFLDNIQNHKKKHGDYSSFFVKLILNKLGAKASSSLLSFVPIVGGIIAAYNYTSIGVMIINMYAFIHSPAAQLASTLVKTATYSAAYQTLKLAVDEAHVAAAAGVYDITIKGAESQIIDGAERSFAWNAIFGNPPGFAGSINPGAMFAKTAYAADYPYDCKPEIDEVFCPNWRMDTANRVTKIAEKTPSVGLNSPIGQDALKIASDIVNTIDAGFEAVVSFVSVPDAIEKWLSKSVQPVLEALTNYALLPPITDPEEDLEDGAKMWDASYMGANTTVNDSLRGSVGPEGKYEGYGARVGSTKEVAALDNELNEEENARFASASLWDKMFSHEYPQSFANQLALALPSNPGQTLSMANPGAVFGMVGKLVSGKANAEFKSINEDAIYGGMPQYTFGSEVYTKPVRSASNTRACKNDRLGDNKEMKDIGAAGTKDAGLGRAEFKTSNICLLDETVAELLTATSTNEPFDEGSPAASESSDLSGEAGEATGKFAWPIVKSDFGQVSSCYGSRSGGFHHGLDMWGKKGSGKTEVLAVDGGKVITARLSGSAGNMVVIDHGKNLYTIYMHMSKITIKKGKVAKGQKLGTMGNTGDSTGPHLHLTVAKNKPVNSNPYSRDPLKYLSRTGVYKKGLKC